jgi:hypothetical protein
MPPDDRLARRIRDATVTVLADLSMMPPKVEVEPRLGQTTSVFDVIIHSDRAEHRFTAGWAGKGWKPDIERLLAVTRVQVVYAASISDEAKEWLRNRRLGWLDETGAANIALPTGLVLKCEGHKHTTQHPPKDRWTKAMLAAVEAILAGSPPTVEAVEEAVAISRGASASALSRLEQQGLLDRPGRKRGRGISRRVVDMDLLIDRYAEAAADFRSKQKVVMLHRLLADPLQTLAAEIGPALNTEGATWAVSGPAASTLLAPYLGDVTTLDLYVDHRLFAAKDHLAILMGGRVVEKGHRVEVRELPTAMSARGPEVNGVHVALPARVYADLVAAGGRAAEAANHLREVRGVGPSS